DRGTLAPYEFDYEAGDPSNNPDWGGAKRDRWDVYRDVPASLSCPSDAPLNDPTLDGESPYTDQKKNPQLDRWSGASTLRRIVDRYIEPGGQLYFKIRVALKNQIKWQTVSGYANVAASGIATAANGDALGWVELQPVRGYHPFAVAAWQYLRLQQPELISDNA